MSDVVVESVLEEQPGERWRGLFRRYWPAYRRWFESGAGRRPNLAEARGRLAERMPELVGTYDLLVELADGDETAARFLTLYNPAPYIAGCSQVVWTGDEPALIRNYDYSPKLWEGVVLASSWSGRRVIAMSDCLWGVLDGMNEAGLVVSLAFGGRRGTGDGFGCPLILRYLLERSQTAPEAAELLVRLPTHMAYNVTVVDRAGEFFTACLAPDRPAIVRRLPLATNHQGDDAWEHYVRATSSVERERFLAEQLGRPNGSLEQLAGAFLAPPLYNARYDVALGTLYTAVYRPAAGSVEYRWPDSKMVQSFTAFEERRLLVKLSGSTPSSD